MKNGVIKVDSAEMAGRLMMEDFIARHWYLPSGIFNVDGKLYRGPGMWGSPQGGMVPLEPNSFWQDLATQPVEFSWPVTPQHDVPGRKDDPWDRDELDKSTR